MCELIVTKGHNFNMLKTESRSCASAAWGVCLCVCFVLFIFSNRLSWQQRGKYYFSLSSNLSLFPADTATCFRAWRLRWHWFLCLTGLSWCRQTMSGSSIAWPHAEFLILWPWPCFQWRELPSSSALDGTEIGPTSNWSSRLRHCWE